MQRNQDLIYISEAANYLGVSRLTLRNWDKIGFLQAIRIGKRKDRKYRKTDLESFANRSSSTPPQIQMPQFLGWKQLQRFWFEEISALPLCIELGIRNASQVGNWTSPGLEFAIILFESDYAHQALSVEESIAFCTAQVNQMANPEKRKKFAEEWNQRACRLNQKIDENEFLELKKLSNSELLAEFKDYLSIMDRFWSIGMTVEPYSPYLDRVFVPEFQRMVIASKKRADAFSILTQPRQLSFLAEAQLALIKIATKFFSGPTKRKDLFVLPPHVLLGRWKKENPDLLNALQDYRQRFFWIQNSYSEWTTITLIDTVNFVKQIVQNQKTVELKKELEKLTNTTDLIRQQENLVGELNLPQDMIQKIEWAREVCFLRDERKRMVLKMLHPLYRYIYEFAYRTNLDPKLVAYAQISEIGLLLENKIPVETLKRRRTRCFVITQNGNKQSIITGNESETLKNELFQKTIAESPVLHGVVASRGSNSTVTGIARVILDPKNQKLEPDEILVTAMTRPDFIQIARQAKAIVTNEGGITCHAAIISREMNKPCIIGTQTATKTIRTGDELELRMNHGIINIKK